ncbi:MAG: gamma-glutamylcyclotransferase family protein [Candidatus Korobacteraceae bacterium]
MTNYLFVYGTLRPGDAPAEIERAVRKLRLVGDGWTYGHLYDFGDYPGAIFGWESTSKIVGQVYEFVDGMNLLRKLDIYEEFDELHPEKSLFVRKKHMIWLDNHRHLLAWVYEYNRDPSKGQLIPHGEYRRNR